MKLFKSPTLLWLAILLLIFQTSCTKDSDLLAEYVVEESITAEESAAQNSSSDSSSSDSSSDETPGDPDPQPENRNVEPGFYVTVDGSANNDGLTEATAWSLEHAFNTAGPGDIVYVKAGNYASTNISTTRNGSSGNPIKFIGYNSTPGDIVAFQGPTFTESDWLSNGQALPSNLMPHLEGNPVNSNPASDDIGFKIDHDYIELHNFMISEYYKGVQIRADNIVLDNIIGFQFGNWNRSSNCWDSGFGNNCDNVNGMGIHIGNLSIGMVSNITVTNSIIIDAGMAAFFPVNANNVDISWCRAITYNKGNGSDYLFDFYKTSNSRLTDCFAWKNYTGGHQSRALSLQAISDNNIVERLVSRNVRIQLENARNNILRDVYIENEHGLINSGGLQLSGQSNDNTFINWEMTGAGIQFLGGAGENQRRPHTSAGDDNYFINFIVRDLINANGNGLISFHRLSVNYEGITGGTNYVINMTADNFQWMINANRSGTIHFYNSTFSNAQKSSFDTFYTGWPDRRGSYTATFTNCNDYSNAFPPITGTNITTHNPMFNSIQRRDFTLQSGSPLRDIGMDASTISPYATTDFSGNSRGMNGGDSIGAYEN